VASYAPVEIMGNIIAFTKTSEREELVKANAAEPEPGKLFADASVPHGRSDEFPDWKICIPCAQLN